MDKGAKSPEGRSVGRFRALSGEETIPAQASQNNISLDSFLLLR